jgi:hypothetical protein
MCGRGLSFWNFDAWVLLRVVGFVRASYLTGNFPIIGTDNLLETGRWFKWNCFTLQFSYISLSYETNLDGNSIHIDEYGGISQQNINGLGRSSEPKVPPIGLLIVLC